MTSFSNIQSFLGTKWYVNTVGKGLAYERLQIDTTLFWRMAAIFKRLVARLNISTAVEVFSMAISVG
jgi:hypothetical protein